MIELARNLIPMRANDPARSVDRSASDLLKFPEIFLCTVPAKIETFWVLLSLFVIFLQV